MKVVTDTTVAYQVEILNLVIDAIAEKVVSPLLVHGNCSLPKLRNNYCVGTNAIVIFLSDVAADKCAHEEYPLGKCQIYVQKKYYRMHCPWTKVVDYFDPGKITDMCGFGEVVLTEGNLLLRLTSVSDNEPGTVSFVFGATRPPAVQKMPMANLLIKTNTDLLNQLVMYSLMAAGVTDRVIMARVEEAMCADWKRAVAMSDALLAISSEKSAEILMGRRENYKLRRNGMSITWTPCVNVTFLLNATNELCLDNWPGVTTSGMKGYYNPVSQEVVNSAKAVPCGSLRHYLVEVNDTEAFDLQSGRYVKEEEAETRHWALPDEQIIHTSSLYNITDHESIRSYDLLADMVYESSQGIKANWMFQTPLAKDGKESTTNKDFESPGIDMLLKSILPGWLYNIGDIFRSIVWIIVVAYVVWMLFPIVMKCSVMCKKKVKRSLEERRSKQVNKLRAEIDAEAALAALREEKVQEGETISVTKAGNDYTDSVVELASDDEHGHYTTVHSARAVSFADLTRTGLMASAPSLLSLRQKRMPNKKESKSILRLSKNGGIVGQPQVRIAVAGEDPGPWFINPAPTY